MLRWASLMVFSSMAKHLCNIGRWHNASVSPSMYMCLGASVCVCKLSHCMSMVSNSHMTIYARQGSSKDQRLHNDVFGGAGGGVWGRSPTSECCQTPSVSEEDLQAQAWFPGTLTVMLHLADQAATITLNESCESTLVLLLCIATCRPNPKEPVVRRLCCCICFVAAQFCCISACLEGTDLRRTYLMACWLSIRFNYYY